MNSTSVEQTHEERESRGVPSGDLVRHLFPRNPERDAQGNAVLYPGLPRFEGVAALYNTPHGELVVLAPNFEALNEQVRRFDIGGEVERCKCIITEGRRVPNNSGLPRSGGRGTGQSGD